MADRTKKFSIAMPQRIQSLRKSRNFTQKQLGEMLYKSESTVRMWELGASEPDAETIRALSQIFNISTDYIIGRPFDITVPLENWHRSKKEDFERASTAEREYLLFKVGKGRFSSDAPVNDEATFMLPLHQKLSALDDTDIIKVESFIDGLLAAEKYQEPTHQIKIAARGGGVKEITVTDSQLQDLLNLPEVTSLDPDKS